jgi:hypothetical protein
MLSLWPLRAMDGMIWLPERLNTERLCSKVHPTRPSKAVKGPKPGEFMLISVLTLTSLFSCIEPPSSTSQGEPGGAAKPGAPAPGTEQSPTEKGDGPDASKVPDPHDGSQPGAPTPKYSQDNIPDAVSLTLKLVCADCTGELLVRVEDASHQPPSLAAQKTFAKAGEGTILVPKGIKAVVMVVDDANKNGQPTPGENIGIWTGGLLDTSAVPGTITLEVGVVPDEPPLPPAANEATNKAPPAE